MNAIQHVDELLELSDIRFVELVYETLLGREPDPEGMRHYLGRLRAGSDKATVIGEIASSPEAKACGACLLGMNELMAETKWAGGWLRSFRGRARAERQLNRIENELGRVTQQLTDLDFAL